MHAQIRCCLARRRQIPRKCVPTVLPKPEQVLKSAVREAALLQQCKGQPHMVQMHQAYRSESGRCVLRPEPEL